MKSGKNHIGSQLKKIRTLKGITQEELAKKIGKTRPLVSYFERTGIINKYTLQDIAAALNVSVSFIENFEETNLHYVNKIENNVLNEQQENALIQSMQNEIKFLKNTIEHQWKLIFELTKNIE
ncbi:MAG: helix-turn-helix transcriptional regulator [Chitinophagales bacterium]